MASLNLKEEARRLIDKLPEDFSWADLIQEIHLRQDVKTQPADSTEARKIPVVTAIFDGEVLRLDRTVNLEPGKRYAIAIETEVKTVTSQNAWDVLEEFAGTVEAPSDWAMEHDHYLYGTPKSNLEDEL
ncbi:MULTISPECIES: hypothetical protein [unclassified Moorena]|uniref:hypothetical protein n=1 Tax=unclassified Moorena TaxID=2683338 RepID=UPI0025FC65F8|nr:MULTISPECIES: hypothetical protein [unclassified Moorena]